MSDTPSIHKHKPLYSNHLARLLRRIRVNEEDIESIIKDYESDPDAFESHPASLYAILRGMGLHDGESRFVVDNFFSVTKGVPIEQVQASYYNMTQPGGPALQTQWNPYMTPPQPAMMPFSPASYEPPPQEDPMMKEMRDFAKYIMMMKMITGDNQQQQMQMPPWMMMAMMQGGEFTVEERDGKPVYTYKITPAKKEMSSGGGGGGLLEQLLIAEKENASAIQQKFLDMVVAMKDQENEQLKERIRNLERINTPDMLIQQVNQLKALGLFPEPRGVDPEVLKLTTELEKWKLEKELQIAEMKSKHDFEQLKFLEERAEKREARQFTQQNLAALTNAFREGITSLGSPLAEAMAEGIRAGAHQTMITPPSPQQPSASPSQPTQSATPPPSEPLIDVSGMGPDELAMQLAEIERAEAQLASVKKQIQSRIAPSSTPSAEETGKAVDDTIGLYISSAE